MTPEYSESIKSMHDNRVKAIGWFVTCILAVLALAGAVYLISGINSPTFLATCQNVAGGDVCTIKLQ